MKKYHIIFSLILATLTVGCQDFLEEEPETFFSEEQVFSTVNGVETAVNGLYQSFADPAYVNSLCSIISRSLRNTPAVNEVVSLISPLILTS